MEQVSDFVPNECGSGVDDKVDRISQLPDGILFVILSFLRYKEAAATTVLSSLWLDLWKQIPNLKFDRISQLPTQIIAVILSFLPLSEAAATSILSSRWSNVWRHTPNLVFEHGSFFVYDDYENTSGVRGNFIEIVNSIVKSHKALSLKRFILHVTKIRIAKCVVTKWLEFVFSRQVERLILSFDERDNHVLEELLRESMICLQPQTELIFFKSLKRLWLENFIVSGEDIKLFLHECLLLEDLRIRSVTLTSDVEVCGEKLMLKYLSIYECRGEKFIKVSAPNLSFMTYRDISEGAMVLFENAPKLVEAEFELVRSDFMSSSSGCFSQLQILNLELSNCKMLFQLHVILENGFGQMPNLKKLLMLCGESYDYNLLPVITALIWAYPLLEEFKLSFSEFQAQHGYMQVMTNFRRPPHRLH